MKKTYSRAFTLIELLVVIAIIGILTAMIVTNLSQSRAKARDAKRISDIGQIQLVLELFYDRCKEYPITPLDVGYICPTKPTVKLSDYISQIPTPPSIATYDYSTNSKTVPTDYILHTTLEFYNEAIRDGLSVFPNPWVCGGGFSVPGTCGPTPTCGNSSDSKEYCVAPR